MTGFYYENETFKGQLLMGEDLSKKEFVECTFQQCDFTEANLSGTDFIDCTFEHCNLSMVVLEETGLKNVSFKSCKLMGVDFQVCNDFLLQLKFEECQLDFANFQQMKLSKTQFLDCRMESVEFQETDLSASTFNRSQLTHSHFHRSNLEQTDFREVIDYRIDPTQNRIKGAKFSLEGIHGLLEKFQIVIS